MRETVTLEVSDMLSDNVACFADDFENESEALEALKSFLLVRVADADRYAIIACDCVAACNSVAQSLIDDAFYFARMTKKRSSIFSKVLDKIECLALL